MNRLAEQTSPYLRQHAEQPVFWQPWDEAALRQARAEDKPILLSIGYSACHWCHVMAHEAFSDPETADAMNHGFINIKVDREERPDLDRIYQLAHQLLNRRGGGWPLTLFLDPHSLRPFFAGTYFPRDARHGIPAFIEVCRELQRIWSEQRDAVQRQNASLQQALDRLATPIPGRSLPDTSVFRQFREQWLGRFDARHGGLQGAPKFPQPAILAALLEQSSGPEPDAELRASLIRSLDALVRGGLYDHLAGGFFRYCVDERWEIPHFEKMLYDNGQLLALMSDATGLDNRGDYARIVRETGEWLLAAMQAPEGGFYATLDADSEGQEGRYYLWTREQLASLLEPEEYRLALACYGMNHGPNFREDGHEHWHLTARPELQTCAEELGIHRKHAPMLAESIRQKLLAARAHRIAPQRDEKLLTAWNGLVIAGLAKAGARLNRPDFIAAAQAAVDRIRRELWRDGRLLAVHCAGVSHQMASLDDLAFMMQGLLSLLGAHWRDQDFHFLLELTESLRHHYADRERGGFYFTADDHEPLIQRPKPFADEAIPAGNALVARLLLRLGHLLADPRLLGEGERTIRAAGPDLGLYPMSHASLLGALRDALAAPELILLRGPAGWLSLWHDRTRAGYHPKRLVLAIPNEAELPATLAQRYPPQDQVTAWICEGSRCLAPITDLEQFTAWLDRDSEGQAWR